jgi:hypothetical protein
LTLRQGARRHIPSLGRIVHYRTALCTQQLEELAWQRGLARLPL